MGLNQDLRYDELHKLTSRSVTMVPGTSGKGSPYFSLRAAIKNSTVSRTYTIRERRGESELRLVILLDPFIPFLSWMMLREKSLNTCSAMSIATILSRLTNQVQSLASKSSSETDCG